MTNGYEGYCSQCARRAREKDPSEDVLCIDCARAYREYKVFAATLNNISDQDIERAINRLLQLSPNTQKGG